VAWGQDGFLYAGGEAGQIYRIDVQARTTELVGSTEGMVLGIALDAIGDIYICNAGRREVLRMTQDGQVSTVSRGSADRPFATPNFPVFDSSGRLFVSDSGTWDRDDGCIFVIEPNGETTVWSTEVGTFPNGLAIDPAGEYLYVAESTGPAVSRLRFEEDGRAGSPERVLELPGTVPDGLAFEADGGLIVACYRPDVIYRLDALGNLSVYAEDPRGTLLAAPTNVCFGGPGLGTLYSANLGRWHISELPGSLVGAPLHYPAGLR
jgi:gluconolactonase